MATGEASISRHTEVKAQGLRNEDVYSLATSEYQSHAAPSYNFSEPQSLKWLGDMAQALHSPTDRTVTPKTNLSSTLSLLAG